MFNRQKVLDRLTNHKPYINGSEYMRRSSVFIPLVRKDGEIHILFEVRASSLKHRPSEISFPGGGIEEGETAMEAAIRETQEEIGSYPEDIKIISELDLLVTPVKYIIHPFAGYLDNIDHISLNKDEVDHVFMVPLSYLLENHPKKYFNTVQVVPDQDLPFDLIPGNKNYKFENGKSQILFYKYKDYVIWGITAKILYNFLEFFED